MDARFRVKRLRYGHCSGRSGDRHAVHRNIGIGKPVFQSHDCGWQRSDSASRDCTSCQRRPPRHLHRDQDEWFHVIEGKYVVEIGDERYVLGQHGRGPGQNDARIKIRAVEACQAGSASREVARVNYDGNRWLARSRLVPPIASAKADVPDVRNVPLATQGAEARPCGI